jgi:hypothetical protein
VYHDAILSLSLGLKHSRYAQRLVSELAARTANVQTLVVMGMGKVTVQRANGKKEELG